MLLRNYVLAGLLLSCFASSAALAVDGNYFLSKAPYIGVNMGGGSTEWKYLVDKVDAGNPSTTTPSSVTEGGPSWGVVFGYALNKNFAIELQYMQFADSHVQLPQGSSYYDQYGNPLAGFVSKTDAYSLSAKFSAQVAHTKMRAFAAVGGDLVQRTDSLVGYRTNNAPPYSNYTGQNHTTSAVAPYLSSGLTYNFTPNWMVEGGFQYYTGFGVSEVNPVSDFVPFAWDGYARMAYAF